MSGATLLFTNVLLKIEGGQPINNYQLGMGFLFQVLSFWIGLRLIRNKKR